MLKQFANSLFASVSSCSLFPTIPTIKFYPELLECSTCGSRLHVQKTRTKRVVTAEIGPFKSEETVLFCPQDQTIFSSKQLRNLVPEGGTFGFDVIVEVGLAIFVNCRNNYEIMQDLAAKNVFLSERGISYLGRKFIIYLAIAHQESRLRLREFLMKRGGYILHVDGTCEGDSPNLFCGLDGISELVLDTIKIPSEKKELLVPFFERIKQQYGEPIAIVHDMGRGILTAMDVVFPGIPDFICHFHFLRDVGKDLLLTDYATLQKRLQKFKIRTSLRQKAKYLEQKIDPTFQNIDEIILILESGVWPKPAPKVKHFPLITAYALIHWIFQYASQSQGYGFPFDRPHLDFYRRMQKVHLLLKKIMNVHLREKAKDNKPFLQIYKALKEVAEDKRLNDLAASLERKTTVFDKLRKAMRIALPEGKKGINDNGEDADIKSIKEKVTKFKIWLNDNERRKITYSKMIKQLDKYWVKLFADPLPVTTPEGILTIVPQRTNNILERFFRGEKRRGRKKSGTASLNKALKATLAETPLVQNLKNSEYKEIILNGSVNLAERFAKINACIVQKEIENAKESSEKILPAISKVIKNADLTIKISSLFSTEIKNDANRHLRS